MGMTSIFVMWSRSHSHFTLSTTLNLSSFGFVATQQNILKHTDGSAIWATLAER